MKRALPYLIMFVLGVLISTALATPVLGHSARGASDTVNVLRIYPEILYPSGNYSQTNTSYTFEIDVDQTITQFGPSFRAPTPFGESFFSQGRCFELVVNGYYPDAGFGQVPWVNPQNMTMVVENGQVGGLGVNILGDFSSLPGFPTANLKVLDYFNNLQASVDGPFDYTGLVSGTLQRFVLMERVAWGYSIDGTSATNATFTLTVSDGTDTASVDFPCQANQTNFAVTYPFVGTLNLKGDSSFEIAFVNTGNCDTPPTFGELYLYFVMSPSP